MEVGEQSASVAIPRIKKNRSRLILVGSIFRGMVEVNGGVVMLLTVVGEEATSVSESFAGWWSFRGSMPSKPDGENKETFERKNAT